jgi:hypothetical protein
MAVHCQFTRSAGHGREQRPDTQVRPTGRTACVGGLQGDYRLMMGRRVVRPVGWGPGT